MLYSLTHEWECNGYSDSDWYCVVYDTETKKVFRYETQTTRFAGGGRPVPPSLEEGTELWTEACYALARDYIVPALKNEHFNPSKKNAKIGETLIIRKTFSVGLRDQCDKCNGTGHWVNPKNTKDKRQCFGCGGTCFRKYASKTLGKVSIKAGTEGSVIGFNSDLDRYGRESYDKHFALLKVEGYDQPIRANLSNLTRPALNDLTFKLKAETQAIQYGSKAFYLTFQTGANFFM